MLSTAHVTPFIEKTRAFKGNVVNSFAEALQSQQELEAMREKYESGLSAELLKLSASEQIRLLERVLTVFKEQTQLAILDLPYQDWLLQQQVNASASDVENLKKTFEALEDVGKQLVDYFDDYQVHVRDYEYGIGEKASNIDLDKYESTPLIRALVLRTQRGAQENTRMEYQRLVGEEKAAHWIMSPKYRLIELSWCKGLPEPSKEEILSYGVTCVSQMMGEVVEENSPIEIKKHKWGQRQVAMIHAYEMKEIQKKNDIAQEYGWSAESLYTKYLKVQSPSDRQAFPNKKRMLADIRAILPELTPAAQSRANKDILVIEGLLKSNSDQ